MWEHPKIGDDLLIDMENILRKNAFVEETQKTNERIEVLELLSTAAQNFEIVGKNKEAEAITRVIEFVAMPKKTASLADLGEFLQSVKEMVDEAVDLGLSGKQTACTAKLTEAKTFVREAMLGNRVDGLTEEKALNLLKVIDQYNSDNQIGRLDKTVKSVFASSKGWAVNLWGSDPDEENDDCWVGDGFATEEEARKVFEDPWNTFQKSYFSKGTHTIELDGPGVHETRLNPEFKGKEIGDDDWKREQAMQAGMGGGTDAYNDAMGFSVEEDGDKQDWDRESHEMHELQEDWSDLNSLWG